MIEKKKGQEKKGRRLERKRKEEGRGKTGRSYGNGHGSRKDEGRERK